MTYKDYTRAELIKKYGKSKKNINVYKKYDYINHEYIYEIRSEKNKQQKKMKLYGKSCKNIECQVKMQKNIKTIFKNIEKQLKYFKIHEYNSKSLNNH